MKGRVETPVGHRRSPEEEELHREMRRASSKLNHFRGVAVTVLEEAQGILADIWNMLRDARSCEDILDGDSDSCVSAPQGDRRLLLEKLHMLGIQIDYARRLCNGSIGNESHEEGEK